ncbi:hypothetical protein [Streptomyces sp. GbtcB6]|uniref:hypothetical protein n=1 Tax=Streptomyces sp. GbtcB6 TaxID=2824751 RepID=UPI001C30A774|nr:hypothetical protein [Streptomyces sp. GbtcB6]
MSKWSEAADRTAHLRRLVRELRSIPDLTGEEFRLLLRIFDDEAWEDMTEARGLRGLRRAPGGVSRWDLGWRLVVHLRGRLDFYEVRDRGHQLVTGLGLKRGMHTMPDDFDLTPQQIAECMIAAHRKRRGSVLMVLPGDRSDRAELWFGMSGQLAQVAAAQDELAGWHRAAEAERKAEREAERSAAGPHPDDLAASLAHQRAVYEEFARSAGAGKASGNGAARPSGVLGGRVRTTVCDDVRAVLRDVPGGLSAAEIASKTDRALSKIYACLNEGLGTGEYVKIRRLYTVAPKIEEQS